MTLVLAALPAAAHAWVLKRGDRGEDVKIVQQTLSELGFPTQADGLFGRATARSVRRYERREGLARDGRVSRGQLRGMLRRLGRPMPVELDGDDRWTETSTARPRSAPADGGSTFPIDGEWEWGSDGFGARGGSHKGQDILAACGTPLVAAEAGKVVVAGSDGSAGSHVVIRGDEDQVYMHLQGAPTVGKGDTVQAGQPIGAVGQSGNATTCHLHFEIWTAPGWYEGGSARDPRPDLRRWAGS